MKVMWRGSRRCCGGGVEGEGRCGGGVEGDVEGEWKVVWRGSGRWWNGRGSGVEGDVEGE